LSRNFIFHIRPRKVPAPALRFTLTWGLGGAAVLLVVLQLVTGLILNFAYEPVPVQAYLAVRHIQNELFLGRLLRNLHHWSGHLLVIVVCLHMIRVFFWGAYFSSKRRLNWYMGLFLLLLVMLSNFTGYLLPWDQLAYWAVTIATSMLSYLPFIGEFLMELLRGGKEVSGVSLHIFHSIHTTFLPFCFLGALAYHFWWIRRAGGIKIAPGENREMLPFMPNLLVRELSSASVVLSLLLAFSMAFDAPLTAMANPALTPEAVKAPWYFLWFQELLLHVSPVLAMAILPFAFGVFLLIIPLLRPINERPAPLVRLLFFLFFLLLTGLTVTGIWFRGPGMKLVWPW